MFKLGHSCCYISTVAVYTSTSYEGELQLLLEIIRYKSTISTSTISTSTISTSIITTSTISTSTITTSIITTSTSSTSTRSTLL